ncbi:hypothetical protein D3C86_1816500 [compost metagenome]
MAVIRHLMNSGAFDDVEGDLTGSPQQRLPYLKTFLYRQRAVKPIIAPCQRSGYAKGAFVIVIPAGGTLRVPACSMKQPLSGFSDKRFVLQHNPCNG